MNELSLKISALRGIVCNFFLDLWKRMKGEQAKSGKDSLDELSEQLGCSRREAFLTVRSAWIKQSIGDMTDADRQRMERAMAARRFGVTGLGMKFEYPDGTVRDKWGRIINEEKE